MRFLALLPFLSLAAAHFTLDYPPSRGFDDDTMPQFPCGGFNSIPNRTLLSLTEGSLPVAITLHHTQTAVQILLGLGSDVNSNYNITLKNTFGITGLGSFCLPNVPLDPTAIGAPLTDGLNATLQVVSNGDTGGGLYACADITFTSTVNVDNPNPCSNNTGVAATIWTGASASRDANVSTPDGQAQSASQSTSQSATQSATQSAAQNTSTSSAAAAALQTAAWGILGAALLGGMVVL